MDLSYLNKLFSISNWLFLIPCYCQNSIGDLWNTLVPTKYTKELLKKFKLEDCKMMNTPMHPTCILSKEDIGTNVYQKLYRGMIGSLLYLTASRPDILFSECLCARFQSDPRESHLTVVKRIFRYLKGTTNLGLLYRKSLDYKLVGFCDADYASDRIERKTTSGNC